MKGSIHFLLFSLFLALTIPVGGQEGHSIEWFGSDPCLSGAEVACLVLDLETGDTFLERNTGKLLIPASLQKLVTGAVALELLGPGFQFGTSFALEGKMGNGSWEGDLVITASGDPTLASAIWSDTDIEKIASRVVDSLRMAGITCFNGGLRIDASGYDRQAIPDGWPYRDLGNYYASGIYPVNVFDNEYDLHFRQSAAGQKPEILRTDPVDVSDRWINEVVSEGASDQAYIYPFPNDAGRMVKGRIPPGKGTFTIRGALPDPPAYFARALDHRLAGSGIVLGEKPVVSYDEHRREPGRNLPLFSIRSRPLGEILAVVNRRSHNLWAEGLFLEFGEDGTGRHSLQAASDRVLAFWEADGVKTEDLRVVDGSGLSAYNRLSARFLAAVLYHMYHSPNAEVYRASLPRSGQSGTLRHFLPGRKWRGRFALKTGSMEGVMNYAGYVRNSRGRDLILILMVNDYTCPGYDLRRWIRDLCIRIYDY